MAQKINRAIELLAGAQAIYYTGAHSGHVLTHAQGMKDAHTWADYINIGMEHGAFDMAGLAQYMQGLVDGGPTRSGHPTPAVIVEAPVNGLDEVSVRTNAWQFRQILARGVHGILLCQAESAAATRAFVANCRFSHHKLPPASSNPSNGMRGRGSESTAAPIWGLDPEDYIRRADPWPLNPEGELLLGVKIESPQGVANCEEILAVPGLGFAELGPGDLSLSLGYVSIPPEPYPHEMREARARVFAATRANKLAFLEGCTPDNIAARIDEGVRIVAGGREETARIGRRHQRRQMPV
ncbi:MAG TPA: aldolase/citrate lyase family protein [Acetobacteraceae bacterium]|nr:aldolase/citrate lyase family protein [Acetobacteraceae bacterium]